MLDSSSKGLVGKKRGFTILATTSVIFMGFRELTSARGHALLQLF